MKLTGRFLGGERISGMGFAPDGAILYALSQGSRLLQLDPRSMSRVSEVSQPERHGGDPAHSLS